MNNAEMSDIDLKNAVELGNLTEIKTVRYNYNENNDNNGDSPILPAFKKEYTKTGYKPLGLYIYDNTLSFDVPIWGVKDFINERNYWIKGTNLTPGNEPGWFYFKIFFKFNTRHNLFGGILSEDNSYSTSAPINSALQYLYSLKKIKLYEAYNLKDRMLALYKFTHMLYDITVKTPWMIKSVSNLQSALNINNENYSNENTFDILFNNDTTDMRLATMLDLYKYVCYDDINNIEILPENLRKFDMSVIIYHMPLKYYHTAISVLENNNATRLLNKIGDGINVTQKALGTFTSMFGSNKLSSTINKGVNVLESVNNVAKVFTTKGILMDYRTLHPKDNDFSNSMSYRMFTFHNCEIHTESFGKYLDNVELKNDLPYQFGSSALKIKYDKVYYHNMNEWNQFMFGSDGFYYNTKNPIVKYHNNYIFDDEYTKNSNLLNKENKFTERIKNLINANQNKNHNAPNSEQWKSLIDYSEIALTNSMKNYGIEDLPMPEAFNYNINTGNLYGHLTDVLDATNTNTLFKKHTLAGKVENFINEAQTGIQNLKNSYYAKKLDNLKNGSIINGNFFGKIGVNHENSKFTLSPYLANKFTLLGLITDAENPYSASAMDSIINNAIESFNLKKSSLTDKSKVETTLSVIDQLKQQIKTNKKINNLYGTITPSKLNKTLNDYNLYNYDSNYIDDYIKLSNNYFTKKLSMFATNNIGVNIKKLSGILYDATFGINSDYFNDKINELKDNSIIGSIYDANFGVHKTIKIEYSESGEKIEKILNTGEEVSDYFKTKLKLLATNSNYSTNITVNKPSGNIFGKYLLGKYNETNSYYFTTKINELKDNSIIGSIYDANFGVHKTIKIEYSESGERIEKILNTGEEVSDYFKTKLKLLATNGNYSTNITVNKPSGNIFGKYLLGKYNETNSYYFTNKINELKDNSIIGSIYDADFGEDSEYFKTKLAILSSNNTDNNIIKPSGNIFGKYLVGKYNETNSYYFTTKINELKDNSIIGSIYDADFGKTSEYFTTKLNSMITSKSSGKFGGNLYSGYKTLLSYNSDLRVNQNLATANKFDETTKISHNDYISKITSAYDIPLNLQTINTEGKKIDLRVNQNLATTNKFDETTKISHNDYISKITSAYDIPLNLQTIASFGSYDGNTYQYYMDLRTKQSLAITNNFDETTKISHNDYISKITYAYDIPLNLQTIASFGSYDGNTYQHYIDLRTEQSLAIANNFDENSINYTDLRAKQSYIITNNPNMFDEKSNHTKINDEDYFSMLQFNNKLNKTTDSFDEPKMYDIKHSDKKHIESSNKDNKIWKYFWNT